MSELSLGGFNDYRHRLKEIKSQIKFTECVFDMVVSCHPKDFFENSRPTLKQSWKWLKKLMEEYMNLKRNENSFTSTNEAQYNKID